MKGAFDVVGKGWFIVYGVLLFIAFYLFLAQQQQNGKIKQLQADVAALSQSISRPIAVEPSSAPSTAPSPDLGTPQARDQKRKADLASIKAALNAYRKAKGQFPAELKELVPTYLPSLPQDPMSPRYSYRYVKTTTGFTLTCVLETKNDPDDVKGRDTKRDQIYTLTESST